MTETSLLGTVVVPKPEHEDGISREERMEFLASKFPKWWRPNDVVFAEALPKTSVGKFNKRALREKFKDDALPGNALLACCRQGAPESEQLWTCIFAFRGAK